MYIFKFFLFLVFCSISLNASEKGIDPYGAWIGNDIDTEHCYDVYLSEGLVRFFKNEKSKRVVDFGCGLGDYVRAFRDNGIAAEGYDGHPDTYTLSGGIAHQINLALPFDLRTRFDWVLSLEVGEHIPAEFERNYIENLVRHAEKGIVLSWAVPGQPGYGHVNNHENEYIKEVMKKYGFFSDEVSASVLRSSVCAWWFKNTIMVFPRET